MRNLIALSAGAAACGAFAVFLVTGERPGQGEAHEAQPLSPAASMSSRGGPAPAPAHGSAPGGDAKTLRAKDMSFQDPFGSGRAWFSGPQAEPDAPQAIYLDPRSPAFQAAAHAQQESDLAPAAEPLSAPLLQAAPASDPDVF